MAAATTSAISNAIGNGDSVMSYEDQEKINLFARRNAQYAELKQEVEDKKKELQSIQDAGDACDELMLSEEDDQPVLFKIGEIFVSLQTEEAQEYLEEMKVKIGDDIKEINGKMDDVKKSMDTLKVDLYAKFGSNINLEAE